MLKTKRNKIIAMSVPAIALLLLISSTSVMRNNTDLPIADLQPAETSAVKLAEVTTPKTTAQTSATEPPKTELTVIGTAPIVVTQVISVTSQVQTTPTPIERQTPDSTKYIDGQKHVWDPIFEWIPDYGDGTVTIMDVEDDGYRFFVEADGSVNLNKLVAPDGRVITYDEWKGVSREKAGVITLPPSREVVEVDFDDYR